MALLNHADRVKVACLAQLVNVIAPIMTETRGPAWRQTIFFPFAQMSRFGHGRVLRAWIDAPTYETSYYDPRGAEEHRFALPAVPYLKLAAVHDPDACKLTLFALNRSLDQPLALEVEAKRITRLAVEQAQELRDDALTAVNAKDDPERIQPAPLADVAVQGAGLKAMLAPASWNIIRLDVISSTRTAADSSAIGREPQEVE